MKRMLLAGISIAGLLLSVAGCEPEDLPVDAKTILSSQWLNPSAQGDQLQTQDRLRLQDASCTEDGNEYRYMYSYENGGAGGQRAGDQTRLQLRDGSCGAGG